MPPFGATVNPKRGNKGSINQSHYSSQKGKHNQRHIEVSSQVAPSGLNFTVPGFGFRFCCVGFIHLYYGGLSSKPAFAGSLSGQIGICNPQDKLQGFVIRGRMGAQGPQVSGLAF